MSNFSEQELYEAYQEGLECGKGALLVRGGTRGAEWYADNRELAGEKRSEFILGFNEAFNGEEDNEG